MKKNVALALIIILLTVIIVIYSFYQQYPTYSNQDLGSNKEVETSFIKISATEFYPKYLRINPGEKIIWVNEDIYPHTITSDNNTELNSGIIPPNQTYYHIFNNEGTFKYKCSLRPVLYGEIIVVPEK